MAWASSCNKHHDGDCGRSRSVRRSASAIRVRACAGKASTLGGYRSPISAQMASTIPWAARNATKLGSRGAT